MKPGNLVLQINTKRLGLYIGKRTYKNAAAFGKDYTCSEVLFHNDSSITSTQTTLLKVVDGN
jgi:hypothetical protein